MAASTNQYTTAARLAARVSQPGVDLRTDHDPNEADDGVSPATGALYEAIDSASADIEMYCWAYSPATLLLSRVVGNLATDLAELRLYELRGDTPPSAVQKKADRALEYLQKVMDNKARIPDAAMGKGAAPVLSNFRVDLGRYPGVRVERPRSTGTAEGYRRRTDPGADAVDGG